MFKNTTIKRFLTFTVVTLFFGTAVLPILDDNVVAADTGSTTNEDILDAGYIYNLTKALSYIIYDEYNESAGELAKGRFFGTKGEWRAAEILLQNMTDLGLWAYTEQIGNTEESPDLTKIIQVLDYDLKINNENVTDFHIVPSKHGPRCDPSNLDYNFSYKGLKVYERPKFLLPWKIMHLLCEKEDFLFIEQSTAFIPYNMPPLKKFLTKFIDPMRKPMMFARKILKYDPDMERMYRFFPHCKGVIEYDYNNETYNQGAAKTSVPKIYINGTLGDKILEDLKNTTVDFFINQTYNESVISYNVIGQLNGTDPSKTVIVDCLYDSWWTQGTADAAIGMAMVLAVAKYFVENNITPDYTIKFIGFGGEEVGLRGARYYEETHDDEDILYVVDLNQICFWQDDDEINLTLNLICNKLSFLNKIWKIAKKTDYKGITKDDDIKPLWMPLGAPSDDAPFAIRPGCKTVCFLKDTGWLYHHRDGQNHQEGDSLKYFDWADVNATGEIVLNVVKHLTVKP
ncbi:MAG: M20/M25/M40 family metallo-hydrolase [Thermoplasmatales archaeon]|nr:M20/M25/M40 family metallo-hydrolase [Thermoplasmatales archaeon]